MRCSQQLLFSDPIAWKPIIGLPSLKGVKRMAVDCETYDPQLKKLGPGDMRDGYMVGFSIAIEGGPKFYLPIRHQGGGNFDEKQTLAWAKDNFENFDGEVVGAKLIYDLGYFAKEGIQFKKAKRFYDVQVAEPLLDENRFTFSLDSLAKDYLGSEKSESVLLQACQDYRIKPKDIKGALWELPARYVGAYAEQDAALPLEILKKQMRLLEAQGLTDLFHMESKLIPILLRMRRRGVRVDMKKADEIRDYFVGKVAMYTKEASRLAGHQIEPTKLSTFIKDIDKLQLPYEKTPKSGVAKIDSPWMEIHRANNPLIDCIANARKYGTALGTFIDGYIGKHSINGRIHCEFNQLKGDSEDGKKKKGTIARFSSSNPNLQNIPARDPEIGPMVRALFLPEEGETYVRHDWSQIEYRFLAHYGRGKGAEAAREMYRKDPNTDFHKMCQQMAGKVVPSILKMPRKNVKNVNFGVVYGAGAGTTAKTMKVSYEEAKEFLDLYNATLPFPKETANAATATAQNRGYIKTILGRRRRFHLWEPKFKRDAEEKLGIAFARAYTLEKAQNVYRHKGRALPLQRAGCYKALNGALQGSAADLMKKAMVDRAESGIEDVLGPSLLICHDEFGDSMPETKAGREAIKELKNIMETCMTLRVPIIAEGESGRSWGECE